MSERMESEMRKERYEPPTTEIIDLEKLAAEQGIEDVDKHITEMIMQEDLW